ncbi:hypothetical protein B0T22DRAFT_70583 [Podospora appendiculata]|uniref:Uncharacterized protein n=1 Tax=Podospora appendiculata TaxID=314037 RepID=A0AAE0XJI2_9PEZI|nr:hypothetical protein B0T22DRAFT_70583 [Podospora appendiculata]
MGLLPPAQKLSLAVRKNVRDEWDNNKADIEKQLSDLLGATWTTEINPNAIWPYNNDGYAKDSLGSCIKGYLEGAIYQIRYLVGKYGDDFKDEMNTICHAHVLTLGVEETTPPRFSYCGCDVQDGKLRILFLDTYLGTNIDYACQEDALVPALNNAPSDKPLSFKVRLGIRTDYDSNIKAVLHKVAEMLGKTDEDIKLNPNFEDTFAKLDAASKVKGNSVRDDWQQNMGSFALKYFEGLVWQMNYQKVGEDEMVQEGFLEAVEKLEIAFRIVEKLTYDSYCEVVIEDGVLYLQSTAATWGTNIDYAASKLIDQL